MSWRRLVETAERRWAVRHDTSAVLGGDEFVIVLGSVISTDDAVMVAERIGRLARPAEVPGIICAFPPRSASVSFEDGVTRRLMKNAEAPRYT